MKRIKGFTLIEMIITISLVAILSLVSITIYNDHILKAKATEGYALIGAIRDAQQQYYSEYETFLLYTDSGKKSDSGWTSYESVLGIDARGNKYFTWFTVNIYHYSGNSVFQAEAKSQNAGAMTYRYVFGANGGATLKWNN